MSLKPPTIKASIKGIGFALFFSGSHLSLPAAQN